MTIVKHNNCSIMIMIHTQVVLHPQEYNKAYSCCKMCVLTETKRWKCKSYPAFTSWYMYCPVSVMLLICGLALSLKLEHMLKSRSLYTRYKVWKSIETLIYQAMGLTKCLRHSALFFQDMNLGGTNVYVPDPVILIMKSYAQTNFVI